MPDNQTTPAALPAPREATTPEGAPTMEPCYGCRKGYPRDERGRHTDGDHVTFGGPCPNYTASASAPPEGAEGLDLDRLEYFARLVIASRGDADEGSHERAVEEYDNATAPEALLTLTARVRALEAGTAYAVTEATYSLRASNTRLEDENTALRTEVARLLRLPTMHEVNVQRLRAEQAEATVARLEEERATLVRQRDEAWGERTALRARLTEARAAAERDGEHLVTCAEKLVASAYQGGHYTGVSFTALGALGALRDTLAARRPTATPDDPDLTLDSPSAPSPELAALRERGGVRINDPRRPTTSTTEDR